MRAPTVSIGLPVYNGERFLRFAIDSILAQDFDDFELIISDNASGDRTQAICRERAETDSRIRYMRLERNIGAVPNFQRVFKESRGRYFKWAAHDDVCMPGFLGGCVSVLDAAPESVVLVYPRAQRIDEKGYPIELDHESLCSEHARPHRRAAHVLSNVNIGWAQFGLMRSEALRRTGLHGSFIGSDYVLLAELAMLGKLKEIPEVLFQSRVHPGTSNVVHQDTDEWVSWLDASLAGRASTLPPFVVIGWECTKAIQRLPLRSVDKVLCHLMVPSIWLVRNFRRIAGQYRRSLLRSCRFTSEAVPTGRVQ